MISIIYGGETHGICYTLFNQIEKRLNEDGQDLNVVDLSVERYDFRLPNGYQTKRDDEVVKLQQNLKESETLIFVYPLYWLNVPMLLKGMIDSVLWPDDAFSFKDKAYYKNGYWKGKKAIIVYTLGGGEWFHWMYRRSGLMSVKYPMKVAGVMDVKHFYIDNINSRKTTRDQLLDKVDQIANRVVGVVKKDG